MLTTLYSEGLASMREGANVETRLLQFCTASLDIFEVRKLLLKHHYGDYFVSHDQSLSAFMREFSSAVYLLIVPNEPHSKKRLLLLGGLLGTSHRIPVKFEAFSKEILPFSQAAGSQLGTESASASSRQDSIPRLASVKEEAGARSPLVVATLRALSNLTDAAFRKHLRGFFPLLTRLIACQHTPPEVQAALSDIFIKRIGPLVVQTA